MREILIKTLSSKRARSNALLGLLWVAIVVAVVLLRSVLLPVFLATFLAYVMHPLVKRIQAWEFKGRRPHPALATVSLYVVFFTLVTVLGRLTFPVVAQELVRLGKLSSNVVVQIQKDAPNWLDRSERVLKAYGIPLRLTWGENDGRDAENKKAQAVAGMPLDDDAAAKAGGEAAAEGAVDAPSAPRNAFEIDLKQELGNALGKIAATLSKGAGLVVAHLQSWLQNLFALVFKTFLVLMMSAFLLSDSEGLKRFFFSIIPIRDRETYDKLLQRIDGGLSGVVRGQLIICGTNGLLTLVGMLILGVPLAFLLAGLATVLSLIPIFGSIISTIPIVLIGLTQSFSMAFFGLLWIIGVHLLESNLLNPKIMGDSAKIHPVLVIVALLAGEHFYGLVGALFAVPIASILLTLFRFVHQRALRWQDEAEAEEGVDHVLQQDAPQAIVNQSNEA